MSRTALLYMPFFVLIALSVGWLSVYSNIRKDFLFGFQACLGILAVLFAASFFIFKDRIRLLLFTFSGIVLSLEILICAGIFTDILEEKRFEPVRKFTFGKFPVFDSEAVSFDSMQGYKWSNQPFTVKKSAMETVVFENTLKGNNYGMHSRRDYFPPKQDSKVQRWLVFGDSFTDAYFLKRTWVDALDSLFQSSGGSVELYSFAVNGGGVKNWHRIYTRLIEPEFEFDGVVFAIFGNDLARDFFVIHQENGRTLQKYYDKIPDFPTVQGDLQKEYAGQKNEDVHSDISSGFYVSCLLNYLYRRYLEIQFFRSHSNSTEDLVRKYIEPTDSRIDDKYFITKYKNNYFLLSEMFLSLKHSGKSVILVALPDEYGMSLNRTNKTTAVQQELFWLGKEFGLGYIDGYSILSDKDRKPDEWFIPMDGHWNQEASDSFAFRLFQNYRSLFD